QMDGLHVLLINQFSERATLRQPSDLNQHLQRLANVARRLDEGIAQARVAAKRGLIPPRFILERSRDQLNMFLAPEPAQNIFVTTLAQRMEGIANLKPE